MRALLAASPAGILLTVLFFIPVILFLGSSVADGDLQWYAKALGDGLYRQVILQTLGIAAAVTAVCLVLAYPIAFLLATTAASWRSVLFAAILVPLWTSALVRTYAWMVILGRNGIINTTLMSLGVTSQPVALLYNVTGVIIGMVHVLLPFMILPIYNALSKIDPTLASAAENLGANPARVFKEIYWPLSLTGVVAGMSLIFTLAVGFFITPALLGGGRVVVIAMLIEQQIRQVLNWDFAGALSVVLLAAVFVIYVPLTRWLGRYAR
jgi:ABC-type spermidine/putrescine transport system permease subunit I